jgi:TPR repeat protein
MDPIIEKEINESLEADAIYQEGVSLCEGSDPDYKRAAELFAVAVSKGSLPAKRELGIMYLTGDGVDVDPKAAYPLLSDAAVAMDPNAMYHLALMYEGGIGVEKNLTEALKYLAFAANLGYPGADTDADRVEALIKSDRAAKLRARPLLHLDVSNVGVEAACCKKMLDSALDGTIGVVDIYKGPELVGEDEFGFEIILKECPFCKKQIRRVPADKTY